jgi:hypothetical protein
MSIIVPSSSDLQVFIMSLTDKNPDIWNDIDQLKIQANRRGPLLDSYVWNLHSLGDKLGELPRSINSNAKKINPLDPYWKQIFVDNYSDDQGSSLIVGTEAFNSLAAFTHPVAKNWITKTSLSFSPVINQDYTISDVAEGNAVIYKCFLFPSYPVVITTTISENEHYGPVFANNLSISVSDKANNKAVSVSANFQGGRSLFLPAKKYKKLNQTSINSNSSITDSLPYRTASIFDCAVEFDTFADFQAFMNFTQSKKSFLNRSQFERIIEMNLTVSQGYNQNITAQTDDRPIKFGPRYWNLTKRDVTGSLTWLSNQYNFYIPTSSNLTMYFGAGFYFPMQNVDWQKPKITAIPGQGYLHQFNFIARAVTGAVANGFKSNTLNSFVSEFLVPTYLDR